MKNLFYLISLICLLFFVAACKDEKVSPSEDVGYSYFPYSKGYYTMYNVDSSSYDEFYDTSYHFNFNVVEYYESDFKDSEGRNSIRIERWYKMNDTTEWLLKDVWFCCRTNTFAEKTEENIKFTKLIFPIKKNSKWDGNAYNTYDKEYYKYEKIDEPLSINGIAFDSTLTIIQAYESNLIQEIDKKEIYARNVGMIHKTEKNVEKDFVSGKIKSGIDVTYNIVKYGQIN